MTTFVFIVGTGSCGSTLVEDVLARHPEIGFVSTFEANLPIGDLKGRWNNDLYRRLPSPFSSRELRAAVRFTPSEAYPLLARQVSPVIGETQRDLTAEDARGELGERFRRFFESRARAQRRPVFLHKFTGWPRVGFIRAVFPRARVIHVVRDGRAVAASLVRRPWWRGRQGPEGWRYGSLPDAYAGEYEVAGRSPLVLAGIQWKLLLDAADGAFAGLSPADWTEVRYEDFVRAPEAEAERLLAHMGLAWNAGFERGLRRHMFDSARLGAYRRQLDPDDLARLTASLRSHLERRGYAAEPGSRAQSPPMR